MVEAFHKAVIMESRSPRHCRPAAGMYTCVARNVVGKAYAAAYLAVNTARPLISVG